MSQYTISLENFGGPLDLLLYLIRKDEVDIYDIPIARITCQYLEYLEQIRELPVEEASDFMAMAATLLEIKAKALVPHLEDGNDLEEDIADPRASLVAQLLAYRTCKETSFYLNELQKQQMDRVSRPSGLISDYVEESEKRQRPYQLTLDDLFSAYLQLIPEIERSESRKKTHLITQEIPIDRYIQWITELKPVKLDFLLLFRKIHFRISQKYDLRKSVLGLLLALLELAKQSKILLTQEENPTAPILITLSQPPENKKNSQEQVSS
ncbi:MAG: segregation/condensation protein A [Planctomycetota bacterium]